MTKHIAIITIPFEVLEDILFPEGQIRSARVSFDPVGGATIDFIVEHHDLEPVQKGSNLPQRTAVYTVEDGKTKFAKWQ